MIQLMNKNKRARVVLPTKRKKKIKIFITRQGTEKVFCIKKTVQKMGLFCNKKESKFTLCMIKMEWKMEGEGRGHLKNGVGKSAVSGL